MHILSSEVDAVTNPNFDGHGFVVTGGSGHLGSEMVRALVQEGAVVVAVARKSEGLAELAEQCGPNRGRLEALVADVNSEGVVGQAVKRLDERGRPFSGWVNNANTAHGGGLLFSLDRRELTEAMKALADLMMITQDIASLMRERGRGGSIVNISSMYGLVAPDPRAYATDAAFHSPPSYGAVKAGMLQFSRYAAVHLAPFDIRVNSVSPGPFPSPRVQAKSSFVRELERRVPLGRIGRAEEVAGAVKYLLSDESSYTTGTNIVVDGGWTAW